LFKEGEAIRVIGKEIRKTFLSLSFPLSLSASKTGKNCNSKILVLEVLRL